MKLLIVESEQNTLNVLTLFFKREGYLCEQASDFQEACKKVVNHEYECILLDLNLPGGDGMKLIRILKAQGSNAAIIILSARDTTDDRVLGLNEGADDFMSKPVQLAELNARIKAIARRKNGLGNNLMDFGALRIKLDERSVEADGKLLQLTKKEFDILVYLARNKNRVVTKDSIGGNLWGDYIDDKLSYDYIYAHVKNLRKKLADEGCAGFLKTVYGVGYKFSAR